MATRRKQISKKIRFEVFKRDKFTCQYCGKSAPDVILHVDHIKPVAKGGVNDIMNLITSCRDCNLGKGVRELSDDSIVKKQQRQIQELADKAEQLEMMLEWRKGLQDIKENEISKVNQFISMKSGWRANKEGEKAIKKWITEFPFALVLEAVDIAYDQYFDGSEKSWLKAFNKIGGICCNKSYDLSNGNKRYYYNYFAKACKSKYGYWDSDILHHIIDNYITNEVAFESAKAILIRTRYWEDFTDKVETELYD